MSLQNTNETNLVGSYRGVGGGIKDLNPQLFIIKCDLSIKPAFQALSPSFVEIIKSRS